MSMNQVASDLYKALSESDDRKVKPYDTKAEVLRTEGNIVWVKIPGGVDETPVQKTNNANDGDQVMVRISGGRAWLLGNETSPATDNTVANAATQLAEGAGDLAKTAADSAIEAQQNAQIAYNYANQANDAAIRAQNEATQAQQGAYEASVAAETANAKAEAAQSSAESAQSSADNAQLAAMNAATAALNAQNAANDALEDAVTANDNALSAQASALTAQGMATAAQSAADTAQADATTAYNAAVTANTAASGAIESLGIVEDVLGVLNWVSEHGTYKLTQDTTVVPSKYYFSRSGGGTSADPYTYSIVTPAAGANPNALGYFELDSVDEAVSNYIATHVALSAEGLYLQTSDGASTSRLLVSPTNGVILYGPDGSQVAQYGTATIIGTTTSFNVRISDQEVGFYDQDNRVAYVNGNTLYITQSVVLDEMKLGPEKWIWKYDSRDDSIFLKWIG